MPGDPKECRQHALACVRLAQTSASPQAREEFANVPKVIKAGEDVVEVVGRIPASNLASWGLTEGDVHLVLPGEPIGR